MLGRRGWMILGCVMAAGLGLCFWGSNGSEKPSTLLQGQDFQRIVSLSPSSMGIVFTLLGLSGQTISAFVGAVSTMVMVYGLSRLRDRFTMGSILLAGVAISFFCSSAILFIQYLCGYTHLFRMTRWLMGELAVTGFGPVREVMPLVFIGSVIVFCLGKELNLLTTGEELAVSRGLNARKIEHVLFFATSLMVGGVVACCGPIGFVGMMAPHICRFLVGADHRLLIPATFFFGGCFLTLCDTLARVLIAPAEMPVGVITALLGGPFFIWLLLSDGLFSMHQDRRGTN